MCEWREVSGQKNQEQHMELLLSTVVSLLLFTRRQNLARLHHYSYVDVCELLGRVHPSFLPADQIFQAPLPLCPLGKIPSLLQIQTTFYYIRCVCASNLFSS